MRKDVFEFKGIMYRCVPSQRGGTTIVPLHEVPNYSTYNVTEEVIPVHLRNLNKRQLRERVMLYEVLVKEQGKLLKEYEKDRLV